MNTENQKAFAIGVIDAFRTTVLQRIEKEAPKNSNLAAFNRWLADRFAEAVEDANSK
jgi:hypothetical protein